MFFWDFLIEKVKSLNLSRSISVALRAAILVGDLRNPLVLVSREGNTV